MATVNPADGQTSTRVQNSSLGSLWHRSRSRLLGALLQEPAPVGNLFFPAFACVYSTAVSGREGLDGMLEEFLHLRETILKSFLMLAVGTLSST